MAESEIRTVIFDLGMVLVTFDWNLAIPRFAARSGGDTARVVEFLQHPFHEQFERSALSEAEFFRRGQELMGFQGTQAEFKQYWNEIFTEIPSSIRLLRVFADRLPVFALSNTNPWHADYLEARFDWLRLFDERIYSFAVGARKPDPAIYRYALGRAGTAPQHALMVDDRAENIEAARALGMPTLHVTSPAEFERQALRLLDSGLIAPAPAEVKANQ